MNRLPIRPTGSSTVVGLLLMLIVGLFLFAATPSSAKPRQSFYSGKIQCSTLVIVNVKGFRGNGAKRNRQVAPVSIGRQSHFGRSVSIARRYCAVVGVCDFPSRIHYTVTIRSPCHVVTHTHTLWTNWRSVIPSTAGRTPYHCQTTFTNGQA